MSHVKDTIRSLILALTAEYPNLKGGVNVRTSSDYSEDGIELKKAENPSINLLDQRARPNPTYSSNEVYFVERNEADDSFVKYYPERSLDVLFDIQVMSELYTEFTTLCEELYELFMNGLSITVPRDPNQLTLGSVNYIVWLDQFSPFDSNLRPNFSNVMAAQTVIYIEGVLVGGCREHSTGKILRNDPEINLVPKEDGQE